jgi:hypothetical protein
VKKLQPFINNMKDEAGKVGVPILMYLLGVPGFVVVFAWLFYFRHK